jgi:hypothetical protein
MVIALTGVAKTNGANVAAKVSAAIPVRAFKGMSAMIFPHRSWKIPQLTTSLRPPNYPCQQFFWTKEIFLDKRTGHFGHDAITPLSHATPGLLLKSPQRSDPHHSEGAARFLARD